MAMLKTRGHHPLRLHVVRPGPKQSALAKAADSGEWQDGQRFSSGASKDEVRTWAKTL